MLGMKIADSTYYLARQGSRCYYAIMYDELIELKRSQMRKGLVEFCILLAISDGRVYSSDILKKLKSANLLVVEGTLYPLLSRLRSQNLIAYDWEESPSGPPRKYFSLTMEGHDTLTNLLSTWNDLQASINSLKK